MKKLAEALAAMAALLDGLDDEQRDIVLREAGKAFGYRLTRMRKAGEAEDGEA